MKQTHRILIAEDNEAMLCLITRHLGGDGWEVLHAHDGHELMQWIERAKDQRASADPEATPLFDVVVSDVRMPGPSGLQCLSELRAVGDPTPVILITAFGSDHLHCEAMAAGARAVLDKPLDLRQLRAAVRAIA